MWSVGDIIGSLIDLVTKEITFFRNGRSMGVAFKQVETGPNMAYFPAIYMSEKCRVVFNFGLRPTMIRPISMTENTDRMMN